MWGLDQSADVYIEDTVSGRYTALAKTRLACRLVHMPLRHVSTGADRAELAGMRNLIFDPSYVMPEQCQVLIDDTYWQPRPGTFGAYRDWTSNVAYRRCDVMRQQTGSF
jgi:hypothetical protein